MLSDLFGRRLVNDIVLTIDRAQRLKLAKADASKEIEAYKSQKAKDLKTFESKVSYLRQSAVPY